MCIQVNAIFQLEVFARTFGSVPFFVNDLYSVTNLNFMEVKNYFVSLSKKLPKRRNIS